MRLVSLSEHAFVWCQARTWKSFFLEGIVPHFTFRHPVTPCCMAIAGQPLDFWEGGSANVGEGFGASGGLLAGVT